MVIKRMLEGNVLVAGGGAVECALSIYLENFATTLGSREQLAIAEFAEALLVIPKTLAVNAAQDATELVSKLRAFHYTSQTKSSTLHTSICVEMCFRMRALRAYVSCACDCCKLITTFFRTSARLHTLVTHMLQQDKAHLKYSGLDLLNGKVRNNLDAGVVEPAISKIKSLRFATEAAITILRIDDLLKLEKQEVQDPRARGGGNGMPGLSKWFYESCHTSVLRCCCSMLAIAVRAAAARVHNHCINIQMNTHNRRPFQHVKISSDGTGKYISSTQKLESQSSYIAVA
eukprot:6891-Heterococcus_DN1.PRE.2